MIKRIKYLILTIILFFSFNSVNAYTKDDIVNLASSINTCSSDTISLVNGFKTTYTRMLNERDVSQGNIDKIYNNINKVKGILNKYNACSRESLSSLPKSVKDELYDLYKKTNKLITSSPKYIDIKDDNKETNEDIKENEETKEVVSNNEEVQIVIDSSTKEIKIYEGGTLIDVVGDTKKLNYVGTSKSLKALIIIMIILLILMIILKILKKKSIYITSFIYVLILLIPSTIIFRNDISNIIDKIKYMSVNINNKEKKVVAKDSKIISYPSYNSKFATIYINGKSEDIYFGDSSEILSKGIGEMTSSNLPGEGGRTVLSGHNTGLFNELFNLNKKDKVNIETIYGKFTYEVINSKIVDDTDIKSIEENYDLILYTCYPKTNIYGNKRLIIYLNLINSDWIGD